MNWGKGIIGGMAVFMAFILGMCVYMMRLPADEYDHQYYEKGLNFNEAYNKELRTAKEKAEPTVTVTGNNIELFFKKSAVGTISFVRPANQYLDRTFKIDTQAGPVVTLPLNGIAKGNWQLVIEWQSDGKAYLFRKQIYLQ